MTHITLPRETVQEVISVLEAACGHRCNAEYNPCWEYELADKLRTALEAPAQGYAEWVKKHESEVKAWTKYYEALSKAAPAAREPLTAAQIRNLPLRYPVGFGVALLVARATEAAHGIGKENT